MTGFHDKDAAPLCGCHGAPKQGYAVPCATCGGIQFIPVVGATMGATDALVLLNEALGGQESWPLIHVSGVVAAAMMVA